jgi:flagellar biosynthetic protein FliR
MENNLIAWILNNYKTFLMVLMRISVLIFLMPIFGSNNIPTLIKIIFSIALTIFITAFYEINIINFPLKTFDYILFLLIELFIGLTLSVMLRCILGGIQLSAQIAGFQMGLSMASIMDPATGAQSVVLGEFIYIIAVLLFFITNAHHFLIITLFESFKIINPGHIIMNHHIVEIVLETIKDMFILSIKLLAPVIVILLFIQIAFGILAKTSPQLNIIVISFAVNIIVGLFFMGLSMQIFWPELAKYLDRTIKSYPYIFRLFAG